MTLADVRTRDGLVRGVRLPDGVLRFMNLPYADAPFGPARFAPPQPVAPWRGVRDATRPGPTPPQFEVTMPLHRRLASPGWIPGDDILNLNVWTPDIDGRRPVAVYIHGGAFMEGNGALRFYDGAAFARDGIVLVTINYRVGLEGFLLLDGGEPNLGLLDQIAALRWVRAHIADFGGDPEQVTVFGQSAGGSSVTALLEMPDARGLFHRAVNQSGPAARMDLTVADAERTAAIVAQWLGVEPTADAVRGIDPRRMLDAMRALTGGPDDPLRGSIRLGPVRDGRHLPTVADATVAPVPLLAGYTTDEWAFFDWERDDQPTIDDVIDTASAVTDRPVELVARLRDVAPERSLRDLRRHLVNESVFVGPVIDQVRGHAAITDDVWLYVFDEPSTAAGGRPGACHSLDLAYVFDLLDDARTPYLTGADAPQEVADAMHGAWVRFFATGSPGWSPYDPESQRYRRFARGAGEESHPDPEWRAAVAEFGRR